MKGLDNFTNDFFDGTIKINILDEIIKWKSQNVDQTPILIINLTELLYSVNQSDIHNTICGGRNRKQLEILEFCFEKIKEFGTKLIFFQCGYRELRSVKQYAFYTDQLSRIDNNEKPSIHRDNIQDYRTHVGLDFESMAKNTGELIIVYGNIVSEMVNYVAKNENVIAILAANSGLLMFDFVLGSTQLWSCALGNFNIKTLYSKKFDLERLRAFLRFTKQQKAVFGSIVKTHEMEFKKSMTNKFFSDENFRKCYFYDHNNRERNRSGLCFRRIKIIASYVYNEFPHDTLVNRPDSDKIIRDVFDAEPTDELRNLIRERYDYFNEFKITNNNDDQAGEADGEPREMYRGHPFAYNVLFDKVICLPPRHFAFIDLNEFNENGHFYAQLILPVYQRNAGFVLQHRGEEEMQLKVKMTSFHTKLFSVQTVAVIYPEVTVPNLRVLLLDESNADDDDTNLCKWTLLLWTLSNDIDYNLFDGTFVREGFDKERTLKPVILALMLLVQKELITVKEADIILITENDYLNEEKRKKTIQGKKEERDANTNDQKHKGIGDKSDRKDKDYPKKLNGRTIRVAHLYIQIRHLVNVCLRTCGLSKYAQSSNFDGVHFHNLMDRYEKSAIFGPALNKIKMYRLYSNGN